MLAALAFLLEMSARVYLFGLAGLVPARINSVRGLSQTGYTQPSREPRLGFELAPNVDGYFKLVPFRTNSWGQRDREYDRKKPRDVFRVAVLGSSFALPAGVEIERAFHSLLEERLSREFAPTRFEFINFAVGMYNPEQVLAMLELRALAWDPDLLLVTATKLSMPGLVDDPSAPRKVRAVDLEGLPSFRVSYPILESFLVRLLQQRLGEPSLARGEYVGGLEGLVMTMSEWGSDAKPVRPPFPRKPVAQGSVIERMGRAARRRGLPIVLVRLDIEDTEPDAVDAAVAATARVNGIPYLDTRPAFRGTRARDFWIYALDPHPNAKAHEIFAREVDTFLRSQRLLPGGGGGA